MLNGYQIIDADAHVYEPHGIWTEYLEPAFRDFAPSEADIKVQGESLLHKYSHTHLDEGAKKVVSAHPLSVAQGFSPESQIQAMYQMGVDMAFIYPSNLITLIGVDNMPAPQVGAYIRAYNHWLRDFCSYNPQMLRGVGVVNLHDPEAMLTDLECIAEWGWKAVYLSPHPIKGRILSDPAYDRFWSRCEELNVAIALHASTLSKVPTTGSDRFGTHFAIHACSHPMEQMMALLALIEGGVLENHPQLKVGFLESGCGWLPYWLWRLDREYEDLLWEVKDKVKEKPSEYFYRQCFIAVEPSETYIPKLIEELGADNIIFGSDYPHPDHKPDVVADMVALEGQLSQKVLQKILWDNPQKFYGCN